MGECMKYTILVTTLIALASPALAQDYKQGIYDTCLQKPSKKTKSANEQKKLADYCTCYAERLSTDPKVSEATKKKLSTEYPQNINTFFGKPDLSNLDPEYEESLLLIAVPFQCLDQVDPNAIKIKDEKLGPSTQRDDTPDRLPTPNYSRQTYSGTFTQRTPEEIEQLFTKQQSVTGSSLQEAPDQQLVALLQPEGVAYYFTQPQHPAHPGYIHLKVEGGKGFPVYMGGYAGDKEAYKVFFDGFIATMNKQLGLWPR